MSDFISREAAIKLFNFAVLDCLGMEPTIRAGDIIKALESIPAADVRPVVRATWRRYSPFTDTYECSNCGEQVIDQQFRTNYCPNCGAKMEES